MLMREHTLERYALGKLKKISKSTKKTVARL